MTTEITINDNLIKAAQKALDVAGTFEEPIELSVDGMTAVLSPNQKDLLSAIHQMQHEGVTYYLGLPND